jgi:hypothetical protein
VAVSLEARLAEIVPASPTLMTVLDVVRRQQLPDVLVMSGGVYQTVWNALTGRAPEYGIKDYDVGYFDEDTSYEAEDVVIQQVAAAFDDRLRGLVEVRNQARVHLWFESHFGHGYGAPLTSTAEALTRFVCPAFAVGIRLEDDESLTIAAPFGLEDIFAMRFRPNPLGGVSPDWDRIIGSVAGRWPELTVDNSISR